MRRAAPFIGLLVILPAVAPAQEPLPLGAEFQVNTYTGGTQGGFLCCAGGGSDVAIGPDGKFVVVWQSQDGQDGNGYGIQSQRFDAGGLPLGGEFRVNSYTTADQKAPSVAVDAGGDFVVVWRSYRDGSGSSIHGQRFDSDGLFLGTEFQVNDVTADDQTLPAVAAGADGDFVVVWASDGSDGSYFGIQGQRFDSAGERLGDEFQVNTSTFLVQFGPAVAVAPSGELVVTWHSREFPFSVLGQRFGSDGLPLGGEFQVNTFDPGDQAASAVAVDDQGRFVVVWMSEYQDGDGFGIHGQRFAGNESSIGAEFQVNTYATGQQAFPDVAMDGAGNFVVSWSSGGFAFAPETGPDGDEGAIRGQAFSASGTPLSGEFQVNTYTTSDQRYPRIAMNRSGEFVVVWTSQGSSGSDSSGWSIQGQRFHAAAIFTDGFESGDTSAWSSSKP